MKDEDKTKEQLTNELVEMRQRVAELEAADTERKRAEEALRQRNRELALINRASQAFTSTLDLDQVLDTTLEEVRRLLDVSAYSVWLIDPVTDELVCRQATGPKGEIVHGWRLALGEGIAGWVAQNGESLIVPDTRADERHFRGVNQQTGLELRSILGVPLRVKEDVIGVLEMVDTEVDRFTPAALRLVESLAASAATAIENARLYEQAQQEITERKRAEEEVKQRNRELATLLDVSVKLTGQLDLDELLDVVARSIVDTLPAAETASLWLYDEQRDKMVVRAWAGHDDEAISGLALSPDASLVGLVYRSRQPQIVDDVASEPAFEPLGRPALDAVRTVLGVPLLVEGRAIGVLFADNFSRPQAFGEDDLRLLQSLAGQAAIAIENARLYEEAKGHADKLAAFYETGKDITSTLELDALLQLIAERSARLTGAAKGLILLVDTEAEKLTKSVGFGFAPDQVEGFTYQEVQDGISGWVLRKRRPTMAEDILTDPRNTGLALQKVTKERERGESIAVAPLLIKGEVIGTLAVINNVGKPVFSQGDLNLVVMLASQAAIAIENARLFGEARQRVAELEALRRISLKLTSSLDLPAVLDSIAESALSLVGATDCHIYLYDEASETFTFGAALWENGRREEAVKAPRRDGLTATVAREGRSIVINDVTPHPLYTTPEARKWGLQAIAGFPLKRAGRVLGVFTIAFLELHTFSEEELRVLGLLADQAAIAIENARLYEETRRRNEELAALNAIAATVSRSLELEQMLESALDETLRVSKAEMGVLYLVQGGKLRLSAQQGMSDHFLQTYREFPVGQYVAGRVALTGEPILMDDAGRDQRSTPDVRRSEFYRSLACLPIKAREKVIGVVAILDRQPGCFQPADTQLLAAVADQIAVAIENARLYEAEQRRRRDAEALRQTALALTSALDRNQVIKRILAQLQQVVSYDSASVQLLRGDRLVLIGGQGFPNLEELLGIPFPVDSDNPNRVVMYTLEPFILEDAPAVYEAFTQEPYAQMGIRSWLGVPMLIGERPVGMITLDKCQPGFYTQEHARLAQAFAAQAAIAIENARLFEEEERRIAQLRTISEVGREIASILDLDELLHRVVNLLVEVFGYYYANVFMADEEAQEIVLTATAGQTGRAFEGFRLKSGEQGITGWVARSGEPLLVNDVDKDPRYYSVDELADTKSELAVPIKLKEEVIGVLDVQSNEPGAFDEVDLSTLSTLADQLAVAIENARLYQETERLAITDGLTGLYNRRHFYDLLEREVETIKRYDAHLSLIMLDIDHFKVYNDTYGHLVGDTLLRELAQILTRDIRKVDIVARYGGDEFVILFPHTDKEQVVVLAERIRTSVEEHEFCGEEVLPTGELTVSVGVANCPEDAAESEALVKAADMALLKAKKWRNRVCVFEGFKLE